RWDPRIRRRDAEQRGGAAGAAAYRGGCRHRWQSDPSRGRLRNGQSGKHLQPDALSSPFGPTGTVTRDGLETFTDLSMNPASGRFIETVVNSASLLVSAQVDAGVAAMVAGVPGVSISGLILPAANADVFTAIAQRFGNNAAN